MKKLFLVSVLFALVACSSEENDEQLEALEAKSTCGFGIFDNPDYDCGYSVGYSDWVAHYNTAAVALGFDSCSQITIRVVERNNLPPTVQIITQGGGSGDIVQRAQNDNFAYFNNLFNDLSTEFRRGQAEGYMFGRGQEPLTLGNGDCGNIIFE
ncbi:hypothetical protein [Aquimarina algicola]|uniref:Lipoprotein n=1 Tax=Aquimarina algicola TaxID=2589995 RepID=A0A504J193_9FLAO|nr:hypothetical protein [Aquimarina algicola]TPN84616.1 hypothetical protein FHK87_16945 [Aquimarina algicola]